MIPQRNISLLANRLAKAGGRRIPESALERDYCLAWFLAELAQSDLQPSLAFKGGTALKRCYFGDYRFSEDLDFTLLARMPFEDIRQRLEPVYDAVRKNSGVEFAFDREDRHSHANSHTFYLQYVGPLPSGGSVKVDVTIRELLVFPLRCALCSERTRSFRTCPKAESSSRTRLPRPPARKLWLLRVAPGASRAIFMIFGISSLTKVWISPGWCRPSPRNSLSATRTPQESRRRSVRKKRV